VAESVLRTALQSLPPDTMVWHAGLPGWKTAAEAGLKAPAAPAFRPSPPAYAPPAPGFGSPPAYAAPAAAPMPGGPIPPNMHWAVVMVLAWITGGLAGLIWAFKEAAFVKKIDPSSKAVVLLSMTLIGMVAMLVLALGAMTSGSVSAMAAVGGLIMILYVVILVLGLVTVFSMRSSIQRYYNSTEPIGLRLSGLMTFFFNILYFQYHFSRIVEWKKTGRLG
jgi:hypothetical protein